MYYYVSFFGTPLKDAAQDIQRSDHTKSYRFLGVFVEIQ